MKINIIYLAAGFGCRFGDNKLLHDVNGKKMYRHVLEQLLILQSKSDEIKQVIVVTQYDEIEKCVQLYGNKDIHVERNEHSELGISSSLRLGLLVDKCADAYLCCVADQPYLTWKTIKQLIEGFKESGKGIGCAAKEGILGNPAIFSHKYLPELLALCGDVGGKQVLQRHLEDVFSYEVANEQELEDIDFNQ